MTYETMIDFPIAGEILFISQKKIDIARKSKRQTVINIYNGKIVKRTGNNKWQVLLLDIGNRYRWFKSDWGDNEYLDTSQYLPLPPTDTPAE